VFTQQRNRTLSFLVYGRRQVHSRSRRASYHARTGGFLR
jgi:hypothetical protein